jgi:hypothetical protein
VGISDVALGGEMTWFDKRYPTEDEARAASFDNLIFMESKRARASPALMARTA